MRECPDDILMKYQPTLYEIGIYMDRCHCSMGINTFYTFDWSDSTPHIPSYHNSSSGRSSHHPHAFCFFHRWIHFGSSDVGRGSLLCCSSFCNCLPLPFVSFCCVVYASCVVSFFVFPALPCHLMCSISCSYIIYIAFTTFRCITSSWNMTHIDVRPYFSSSLRFATQTSPTHHPFNFYI